MTEICNHNLPLHTGGPRVDRALTLHWQADWGQANLHRICGWLAQEVGERSGPGTRSAIWTGRGFVDNVRAVARHDVDLALVTPAAFVTMAVEGVGPYTTESYPNLRALGTIPQRDRLVVALAAECAVRSFADWRERCAGLRIATGLDDGVNHVGLAAREILTRHGVSEDSLRAWGGGLVVADQPHPCIHAFRAGQVDGVVQEAVMTPSWTALTDERDVVFLPLEDMVLRAVREEYGWPAGTVPGGYWRGLDTDLPTLDFSDFLLVTTDELPDDVAYLIAWCLVETREAIERQYRHLPPDRSPITYPLDPVRLKTTSITLHRGAREYFESAVERRAAQTEVRQGVR